MRTKPVITRLTSRRKEYYGMHAEDWYVEGYDVSGKFHEGWEYDFIITKEVKDKFYERV